MRSVETPTETFKKFANTSGWKNSSLESLTADFLSISFETNNEWSAGHYDFKDGKLIDPVSKRLIETMTNSGTQVDEPEQNAIQELQDWSNANESGLAVWISPREKDIYPDDYLFIYRIAYDWNGNKYLLKSQKRFEADLKNKSALRRFIFTEEDSEEAVFEIVKWAGKVSTKKLEVNLPNIKERTRQAEYYATQYRSGVSVDEIAYQMTQSRFLGETAIGCPGTSQNVSGGYSYESGTMAGITGYQETSWTYHSGECVNCGTKNTLVGPCSICVACEKIL